MNARRPLLSRRSRFWLSALALAVFALRALIPTGYMLAPVAGHTRLVMCPAGAHLQARGMAGMSHAIGMDHAAVTDHGLHATLVAEHCPFGLSGGAGLPAIVAESAVPYFSVLKSNQTPAIDSISAAPPPRYHAPRGPPSPA